MKAKWNRLATPLLIAAGTAPLPILMGWGNGEPLLLLWPVAYLIAASACVLMPGRRRLMLAIALAVGMLAAGAACLPRMIHLLAAAMYVFLLLATLPAREIITQGAVFGGMAIHVLCQLFFNMMQNAPAAAVYSPARGALLCSLLIFLSAALLTLNRFSLNASMPEGNAVPEIIRRKNRLLVWLMLGASLLISLIPALGRLLDTLWRWLQLAVSTAIRWLFSLLPEPAVGGQVGGGGASPLSMGEAAQPSTWLLWLERILLGLSAIVSVLLALWLLRILWKKLRALIQWLSQRLLCYAASATEDYVDEVQDTRLQGEERYSRPARRRRPSARELAALPPRQRIRARYALLQGKHPEWPQSHTVRQTLDAPSAQIYERARYSQHEITEQEADAFLK